MKTIIFFFTALLFLSIPEVKATAVIAIIYPNRIILSVDSKLTYTDNATGAKKYKTGCKLSTVNGFAFAFTGYRGYTGNISARFKKFTTDLFIKTVLQKHNGSLNQTFTELVEGLEKELTNQMQIIKEVNPKDYSYYLKEKKGNITNLVVIGTDNKLPFAFALNAKLTEVNGIVNVKAESSVFENKTTILHAGNTDAVAKYIKGNPGLLKEESISLIDKLMNLTIKEKPLDVGLPVDIVEVTGTGTKWIRKKPACPL